MSPFDGRRYARLLEGLDASEIRLKDLQADNDVFRIDSEYFGKLVLSVISRLQRMNAAPLQALARITDGIHTSLPFEEGAPIKVLSAKHPKNNWIDCTQYETVSEPFHKANPRTALRREDVLLSTVGTIGNAAVVTERILPANSDRHIGIIRSTDPTLSPFYLSTFLVSRYGRMQSVRETTGNVQPNLFISKIGRLLVPRFSAPLEALTSDVARGGYEAGEAALQLISQAEDALSDGLGLTEWQADDHTTFVRQSTEAFAAGRLDAEYFTPRFTSLMRLLAQDRLTLQDVAPARHDRFLPKHAKSPTFQYIEIGDVRSDGSAESSSVALAEAPSRATQVVRAGDVLTSTVRPIRRLSAVVADTQDKAVCSSGFVVLSPQSISADTLLTYLRLPLFCELMDLHTSASLYPAISERDLMALPIPLIPSKVQAKVDAAMASARAHKQKSAALLQAAQQAVELAIDKSEAAAMAYLRQATQAWD